MSQTTRSTGADLAVGRLGVRQGAVLPRAHDRGKRRLGPELADPRSGGPGDLALRAPDQAAGEHRFVSLVGEPRRRRDRLLLGGILLPAEPADEAGGGHQLDAQAVSSIDCSSLLRLATLVCVSSKPTRPRRRPASVGSRRDSALTCSNASPTSRSARST